MPTVSERPSRAAHVSSYDAEAPVPREGSVWMWEPNKPHARQRLEVTETKWNGEEWWVKSKNLPTKWSPLRGYKGWPVCTPRTGSAVGEEHWNDLSRFWQATRPS